MLREDIGRFNEWWFTGKIRKELALPFKRHVLSKILESLQDRQVLIIVGLRRIGKTTLLYQTIEKLLEKEEPVKILYFSFEDSSYDIKEVLSFYEKYVLKKPFEEAGKVYIFFDEIHYAKNWSSAIKQFYDLYPNIKFLISGSSSLLLSKEAFEKLAGRFFFLEVKPLTFLEFLEMRGIEFREDDIYSRRIEAYFLDYLRKAGFPEIVDWGNEAKIAEYIRNSVIDKIILKDIPLFFKTKDIVLMEKLVKIILSNPGSMININSLSRDLGENKITISNYLKFLEASLLVRTLSNFRPSAISSSRKLKKFYPAAPSLTFSYSKEIFERNLGLMLETYVVNSLDAKYYFRKGKKEVDIILSKDSRIIPVEVKENVDERDIEKFSRLIREFGVERGFMITLSQKFERKEIDVVPAYLLEKYFLNL